MVMIQPANEAPVLHIRFAGRSLDIPLGDLDVGQASSGEVIWDERYRVPNDIGEDICDYPLARNLMLLTVAVAAETAVRYALTGTRENWSVTLRDFAIRAVEA